LLHHYHDVIPIPAAVAERRIEPGTEEVGENKPFRFPSEGSGYGIVAVVGDKGKDFASRRHVRAAHGEDGVAQSHRAINDEVVVVGRRVDAVDLDRHRVIAG
jgi:hypothetical protein